jgi:HD-GYP domain-containing protein (c-di-GMP phosphodiesterase class II)
VVARVVSVANIYDGMTARDGPDGSVNWREAVVGLRQVAGTELDPRLVETFIEILGDRDLAYRHGQDVDFETELALDERIRRLVQPPPTAPAPTASDS